MRVLGSVSANGRWRRAGSRERRERRERSEARFPHYCVCVVFRSLSLLFPPSLPFICSFSLSRSTSPPSHPPTSPTHSLQIMLEVVTRPTKAFLYGSALFRYIPLTTRQSGNRKCSKQPKEPKSGAIFSMQETKNSMDKDS